MMDLRRIYGLENPLAKLLEQQGICTIEDLLTRYDEESFCGVQAPQGKRFKKVGPRGKRIIQQARAMQSGTPLLVEKVSLPPSANLVMFDLEGMPSYNESRELIYIWGLQVFGQTPSLYIPAVAPLEQEGDEEGWQKFLERCRTIFEDYGDIPFVHWHVYEPMKMRLYMKRYGDPSGGVAKRVVKNLLDLYTVTKRALAVPVSSYSLKVIEHWAGFKRSQKQYGGQWAMEKFLEALATDDKTRRTTIVSEVLTYNREDLEATWAVYQWLKRYLI